MMADLRTANTAHNNMALPTINCLLVVLALWTPVTIVHVGGSAVSWTYGVGTDKGPSHWKNYYPDCGGVMQSPIDVSRPHVLYDPELHYFGMDDYDEMDGVSTTLHNVGGHTAEVIYSGKPMYLRGGNLPDLYQLDQFHFHWGKVDSRGSEHSVNGYHYPMEMHIVHHQARLHNISNAAPHPYGLAVIGFFFQVGMHNEDMDVLLDHFGGISSPGDNVSISFKLSSILPDLQKMDYYRYMGSLTTPPCYETVIWSLATNPITVSEDQMNKFRGLYEAGQAHLVDDFRPVQLLDDRLVTTTSKEFEEERNSASLTSASIISLGLALSLGCF